MSSSPSQSNAAASTDFYTQVVVGPPGVGKSTYCHAMQQYLQALGRVAYICNFDPAADQTPYTDDDEEEGACLFDVSNLISLPTVMQELELGPNGGLMYCMEYLLQHVMEWLPMLQQALEEKQLSSTASSITILLDWPGQAELTTHSTVVADLLQTLSRHLFKDGSMCILNLVDGTYCRDATQFLSASLVALSTQLRLEYPALSVLTKMDLVNMDDEEEEEGQRSIFNLQYFIEGNDWTQLVPYIHNNVAIENDDRIQDILDNDEEYQQAHRKTNGKSKFWSKHETLFTELAGVMQDFGLLGYIPLNIHQADSMGLLVAQIDKATGYRYYNNNSSDGDAGNLFAVAAARHSRRDESLL